MFDSAGRKIKTLAKVICVIGIIASLILGGIMFRGFYFYGIVAYAPKWFFVMVGGSLFFWACSSAIYRLGQRIENTDAIRKQLSNEPETVKESDGSANGSVIQQEQTDGEDSERPPETGL